jgi:hypothetical protein
LAAVLLAPPDAARVTATASKSELRVGEAFVVELSASGPEGTVFTFPKEAGNEAVELREAATAAGGSSPPPPGVRRYQAAAFALGDVELPAIGVPYRLPDGTTGTATTAPIPLRVASILPKEPKEQKLADIRGPVPLAIGGPFWVALGGALLLLGALTFWVWRRRRPRPEPAAAPPVPAEDEALAALERLAASGLVERADYRGYYIALAEIAKRYLERRLGAPVLEMTSAEMAAFLRDHPRVATFAGVARELAGAADRVKFAGVAGLEDEARRHLAAARGLVRGIEERLRPKPEEQMA